MSQSGRVAVTAIGVIAPGAIGLEPLERMLREGRAAIAPVERFDTEGLRAKKAALVSDFRPKEFIPPMKMRRMSGLSRLALASVRMAVGDGACLAALPREEIGVALGSCFGPVQTSLDYMTEYVEKGPALAPPQLFAESVANAPGSHIAIELDLRGFNLTFTQRESSAMAALVHASSQIVKGTVRAAICGGADEMNETIFTVLDRAGALAHADGAVDEASRPFDRRRNGMIAGEGAASFLLEREEAASDPMAFVAGVGMARDTTAPISDWGSGADAVARAMRRALDDAEIGAGEVDAIWASGNSTQRADLLESLAIENLFGERVPPVVAAKGCFGEYTAAGALQLATAFIAVRDQFLPATPGFEAAGEGIRLPIVTEGRSAELRYVLVNSLSAGGAVYSAVVARRNA